MKEIIQIKMSYVILYDFLVPYQEHENEINKWIIT